MFLCCSQCLLFEHATLKIELLFCYQNWESCRTWRYFKWAPAKQIGEYDLLLFVGSIASTINKLFVRCASCIILYNKNVMQHASGSCKKWTTSNCSKIMNCLMDPSNSCELVWVLCEALDVLEEGTDASKCNSLFLFGFHVFPMCPWISFTTICNFITFYACWLEEFCVDWMQCSGLFLVIRKIFLLPFLTLSGTCTAVSPPKVVDLCFVLYFDSMQFWSLLCCDVWRKMWFLS
jgi:hypothetical protein